MKFPVVESGEIQDLAVLQLKIASAYQQVQKSVKKGKSHLVLFLKDGCTHCPVQAVAEKFCLQQPLVLLAVS